LAIEVPRKDLRIGYRPIRPMRILHVVQRNRSLVQVALKDEAGRVDEALVRRIMLHRMLIEVHGGTQRLEIDVKYAVRLRQEPCDLRRRLLSQPGKRTQQHDNDGGNEKRSTGSSAHSARRWR